MLTNRKSIVVLVTIVQSLSHKVRSLPTETKQNQGLKNEILSTPALEALSSPAKETLWPITNGTVLSPANETSSSSTEEALSLPEPETLSSPTEETLVSPANRTLLLSDEGTISSLANETLSPLVPGTLPSLTEGKLLLSAYNGTLSSPVNQTVFSPAEKPSKLPTIMYGPINQQFRNEYPAATPEQPSGESATRGGSIIYGSTTSQHNNKYLTIGQAGDVYLMLPSINEPLFVSVPGLSMHRNHTTGGLIFDLEDPTQKRMEKSISEFNNFQQSCDRIVRLTSPFLTNNEKTPLLERSAKDDFARQTKEIEWLSTVASHRIKLITLYKLLSSTYNELKSKLEVTPEEQDAAERIVDDLVHLNKELRGKTQDLVVYVLLH